MAFYKLTMFFKQGAQGWSDTYYLQANSPGNAYTLGGPGMRARLALLCAPAECIAVRLSDEDIYRDASLFHVPGGNIFPHAADADVPWTAWLFRFEAQSLYWRQLYIRGIPDAVWELQPNATDVSIAAQWDQYLTDFGNIITASGSIWRMKVLQKDPLNQPKKLLDAFAGADGYTNWDVGLISGLAIGDSVSFLNTGLSPAPGKQTVYAIPSATTVATKYRPANDDYSTLNQGAKWRKNIVTYVTPDGWSKERIVHRIVGRPFGLQRGRRPG